jgi:hypothetical protein
MYVCVSVCLSQRRVLNAHRLNEGNCDVLLDTHGSVAAVSSAPDRTLAATIGTSAAAKARNFFVMALPAS